MRVLFIRVPYYIWDLKRGPTLANYPHREIGHLLDHVAEAKVSVSAEPPSQGGLGDGVVEGLTGSVTQTPERI